jgi:hypothetical protein
MNRESEELVPTNKSKSRGASADMSPEAILRRFEIVDELRSLAIELQNAKRLGPMRDSNTTRT